MTSDVVDDNILPAVGRCSRTSKSSGFSALAILLTNLSDNGQSGAWEIMYTKALLETSFRRRTCAGKGLRIQSRAFSMSAAFCFGLSAVKELFNDQWPS